MFGLTDKLLAGAFGVGCLLLAGLVLIQTGRLHTAERAASQAMLELANGQAAWANERTNAAEALAAATTRARETEQQLTAQAEKAEHEKQTQIAAVSARADDLRKRLRNAEANAATARLVSAATKSPGAPEATGVDNWPVIFGPLGEQLVSEAERADRIRLQLASCEASYERARVALSR